MQRGSLGPRRDWALAPAEPQRQLAQQCRAGDGTLGESSPTPETPSLRVLKKEMGLKGEVAGSAGEGSGAFG